ncbi:kinase-like protein [Leucogyrophana mollusca]|uniref:Kinase-like protein n=1 Tax=Leucogyrophana mollusca TaxID=85980 RepID=A0ACB8BAA7_9AGAM|nr:kinase-like protein [Leucogyrophana mollusca]
MVITPKVRQPPSHAIIRSSKVDVSLCLLCVLPGSLTRRSLQFIEKESFKLLHVLSDDAMSSIHLCRKRDTFKLYTIKTIHKDRVTTATHFHQIETARETSEQIRALKNPFLAPFLWTFQDESSFYSISDFYAGGTLAEHIQREGPIGSDRAYFFAKEILAGLSALHDEGIVHHDIRPENVMIDVSGHVAITGFSYAGPVHHCDPVLFQTPDKGSYQPPEVLLGWAHDSKVDIWGFGVVLYMMLFASHPFVTKHDHDNSAVLQTKVIHCPVSFSTSRSVSWAAQDLISQCLQRNSALRYGVKDIKAHIYFCTV